jgi:thioredoxin-like negative regulator of GroEL
VKRLSGVQRFFAKTLFGGGFMGRASWEWATWHLESAVAFRPTNIYHRLELAEVLVDRERYSAAREQLTTIATLPIGDVLDPQYQREAAALLARVAGKRDKS